MENREYTLSEISEISGFPAQTIQYFIDERLLTKPATRGYYTMYSQRFMNRLTLIRRMQENQLGINEIRQRVTNLSDDQVIEMLDLDNDNFTERYPPTQKLEPRSPMPDMQSIQTNNDLGPDAQAHLQASRWQRVEIMPGIELNIKESLINANRDDLQDALAEFIKVFNRKQEQ